MKIFGSIQCLMTNYISLPPALLMMDQWKCERFRASSALRHHLVQVHHLHSQAQDITIHSPAGPCKTTQR